MIPYVGRRILTLPQREAGIDLGAYVARWAGQMSNAGAHCRSRGATDTFLASHGGLCRVSSVTHVGGPIAASTVIEYWMAPLQAGAAVVVRPQDRLAAPIFLFDLTVDALGRGYAVVDAGGAGRDHPTFDLRFRNPLVRILSTASHVRRNDVPAWLAPHTGSAGATLVARRRRSEAVATTLDTMLRAYLRALGTAQSWGEPERHREQSRLMLLAFIRHSRLGASLRACFEDAEHFLGRLAGMQD
jgi:hypothetical protein